MERILTTIAVSLVGAITVIAQAPTSTPTVDQILDKYVQAIGGRAALEKLTTRVMIGSFENVSRGLTVPIEIYAKAPDKYVEVMGFGEASRGFNGFNGWSLNVTENGLRELTGRPLARMKREGDFGGELRLKSQYSRLTLAGKAKVGERKAYVVGAFLSAGNAEKLYFDTQTGLLVRRDVITEITKDGQSQVQVAAEIDLEDYREVNGIKLAFTIHRKLPGGFGNVSTKFREIRLNVPIDDSKFSVPNP